MTLIALLAAFILHIADIVLSLIAARKGLKELNPLARDSKGFFSLKKGAIIKAAYVGGAIAFGAFAHQLLAAACGMDIIGAALVAWNVKQLK